MQLYGTFPSHFTRKVRVVLLELGVPFQFSAMPVSQMLGLNAASFAENPLMKIPVLEDAGRVIVESDLICDYLVQQHGQNSEFSLLPKGGDRLEHLKRLAMINGAMTAGTDLVMGQRSEIADLEKYVIFRQRREILNNTLTWLDQDLAGRTSYGSGLSLVEVALQCLLDWADFRQVAELEPYANLKKFREHWKNHPSYVKTHPSVSA